jgi:hypothetical protein
VDESTVRESAHDHADGTVAGDFRRAGGYLTKEVQASAGEVMKAMPRSLESFEITKVEGGGERYSVHIAYEGEGKRTTVESIWEPVEGEPKITGLNVLSL